MEDETFVSEPNALNESPVVDGSFPTEAGQSCIIVPCTQVHDRYHRHRKDRD